VLRDEEGNAITGNIALAKSLYSAGHDVLFFCNGLFVAFSCLVASLKFAIELFVLLQSI
jgi:hypothetical protein